MSFMTVSEADLPTEFPDVHFSDNVSIGIGVKIGPGSVISAGVRLYPGTVIGKHVQVLENTVIGRPTLLPLSSDVVKRRLESDLPPTSIGDYTVIGASSVIYRGSEICSRVIICDLVSIREHCRIGDDCLIGRSVMIQVNTQIGDRTKIMDTCHLPGDMVVDEDVFMSTHVCGASENSLGRSDSSGHWSGPRIRRGAYIGVNATLLPGVDIGEESVVAAGALVTRDVASRTLVMGVPARYVRDIQPL